MPQYYLRVEGVNLGNVLDDTDDLSTRRGGGLMLLNAAEQLLKTLTPIELSRRLKPVATGASIGLFTFDAAGESDAQVLRDAVRDCVRRGSLRDGNGRELLPLSHGTFVVDVAPVGEPPDESHEQIVARNRWRQLREPTVSLAGLWHATGAACYLDRVRPGVTPGLLPEREAELVSQSVADRRSYGRGARQRFYPALDGRPLDFTDEFAEISDRRLLDPPGHLQPTHDKLAVFYVDGNKFGEIGRQELRKGVDKYQAWSKGVREHHQEILRKLLTVASAEGDPSWRNRGALRLETLLWGGDEIIWVVPAWKGWELAKLFFGHEHVINDRPVTYACGLVFCHTKAPINNIVKLARRLGDVAKDAGKGKHRLAYEVLESFDDITSDLDEHRVKWLPAGFDPVTQVVDATNLPEILRNMRVIAGDDDFPTRQLYRLCQVWRTPEKFENPAATEASALKRLRSSGGEAGPSFQTVEAAFNDQPVAWLHLLQMLPYLATPTAVTP